MATGRNAKPVGKSVGKMPNRSAASGQIFGRPKPPKGKTMNNRKARFWFYSRSGGWVRVSLRDEQNLLHWWSRKTSDGFIRGCVEFEYMGGIVSVAEYSQDGSRLAYWADHDQLDCWFSEEIDGEVHPVPQWYDSGLDTIELSDSPEDYEMESVL